MKNSNYIQEMVMANKFILENNSNPALTNFLAEMHDMSWITHFERWCRCSDFLEGHYPHAATGS